MAIKVRLPRLWGVVAPNASATIGAVGNEQHELIKVGKAGRSRWAGKLLFGFAIKSWISHHCSVRCC